MNIPKEDGTYIILASETNNSLPLRLPVGNESDGNRLQLEVVIIDSLLAFAKANITVFVSISIRGDGVPVPHLGIS